MAADRVEALFRAHMRFLAYKGGAATRRRYLNQPGYYRDIGRLGGEASAAARKARIAARLDRADLSAAPSAEISAAARETPDAPERQIVTLTDIVADLERTKAASKHDIDRLKPAQLDLQAEKDFAGWVAERQAESSADDEHWDPLKALE